MRTLFLIIVLFTCNYIFSQDEDKIKITDLELPNSPAFTILDYTPTNISTPSTPKAVIVSLLNTNAAVEFTPYWVFGSTDRSFSSIMEDEDKKSYSKPYKNLSLSIASVRNDTIQNISIGIRTNLFTWNRPEKRNTVNSIKSKLPAFVAAVNDLDPTKNPYQAGSQEYSDYVQATLNGITSNALYLQTTKDIYDEQEKLATIKPYITIDIAAAYNHFFELPDYSKGNFGKLGAWATFGENISLTKANNPGYYISFYQYIRFLRDEMIYNEETMGYDEEENFDVGGKLEVQIKSFSLAYEYISRTNNDDDYRSVGSIKYKINDKFSVTGGFGKNFEGTDTLVSFLGISWGISSNEEASK